MWFHSPTLPLPNSPPPPPIIFNDCIKICPHNELIFVLISEEIGPPKHLKCFPVFYIISVYQ